MEGELSIKIALASSVLVARELSLVSIVCLSLL